MATDPVCKMNVEPAEAAANLEYAGKVYYFCSDACQRTFIASPEKYAGGTTAAEHTCCGGHD